MGQGIFNLGRGIFKNTPSPIHSIESCGTVDGPGIRYVIFLQGCPMRCLYCHNPDTWEIGKPGGISLKEALDGFYSNLPFYRNGGVTVTGGEPLLHLDFLLTLFRDLKKHHVHTCIDTSGIVFCPQDPKFMEKLDELLLITDLVLLDIKHMNDKQHRKLTGHSNSVVLAFAHYLDARKIPVWIRHVIVPGITFYKEYLEKLGEFIAGLHNVEAIDVLPYHSLGKSKYDELGADYPLKDTREPTTEETEAAKQLILHAYRHAKATKN